MILETKRLLLREMNAGDYEVLAAILQDGEIMYAYEGAFTDTEVRQWLDNQYSRYRRYGYGLWAVILKETGKMIGQCGITRQPCRDQEVLEVGYLFHKDYWHQGYATEAAAACKAYAFETLGAEAVYSIIRDNNIPSQNVALRNGMTRVDCIVKHYKGVDMPHFVYQITREDAYGKKDGNQND